VEAFSFLTGSRPLVLPKLAKNEGIPTIRSHKKEKEKKKEKEFN